MKMKTFIFEYVSELTTNYHGGGGLVVVAENEEKAKELIAQDSAIKLTDEDWAEATIYNCNVKKPLIFVFPDAGCC